VDEWVEEFQKGMCEWQVKVDNVADVASKMLMPFIEPMEDFLPDGDFSDSEDEQEQHKTGKKKPAELRKAHDTRNKQLLEGAFLGTLHLQREYAKEQDTTTKELRACEHSLELEERALTKKVPLWGDKKDKTWKDVKKKELIDKNKHKKILDQIMPPKLRTQGDWKKRSENEAGWVKWLLDSKKEVREKRKRVEELNDKLKKLASDHSESKTAMQFLLDERAEINYADKEGFTALMLASRNGHKETVAHLLTASEIKVDQTNKYGSNAMHYAAMYAHKEICEMLRKGTAKGERINKNVVNKVGKTPVDLAIDEHRNLLEHKEKNWLKTYKERYYVEVKEMKPKDAEDTEPQGIVYNKLFNLHNPEKVVPPKKFKPGRWRISKVPDPACREADFTEAEYMQRWKSAAKRIWIGEPPKPGQDIHEVREILEKKEERPKKA